MAVLKNCLSFLLPADYPPCELSGGNYGSEQTGCFLYRNGNGRGLWSVADNMFFFLGLRFIKLISFIFSCRPIHCQERIDISPKFYLDLLLDQYTYLFPFCFSFLKPFYSDAICCIVDAAYARRVNTACWQQRITSELEMACNYNLHLVNIFLII